MRHEAQKSIAFQDMLPADAALCGYSKKMGGETFLAALRAWEKRRGLAPVYAMQRRASAAGDAPANAPAKRKQTREERLARKRIRARQRIAEMTPERRAAELQRVREWRKAKKEARSK